MTKFSLRLLGISLWLMIVVSLVRGVYVTSYTMESSGLSSAIEQGELYEYLTGDDDPSKAS